MTAGGRFYRFWNWQNVLNIVNILKIRNILNCLNILKIENILNCQIILTTVRNCEPRGLVFISIFGRSWKWAIYDIRPGNIWNSWKKLEMEEIVFSELSDNSPGFKTGPNSELSDNLQQKKLGINPSSFKR